METPDPGASPAGPSDELLLDRWRQGDSRSFECLFVRHYRTIYRLLYSVVGNHAEAEDLTMDTFLLLYERPPRRTTPGGAVAWLRRVALNRGRNALRGARRSRQRLAYLPLPAAAPDPSAEALRAEENARIRRALLRLPDRQRALLLLRQNGLSYAEIAPVIRVAAGSVGTLLARAERAFLKAYADEGGLEDPEGAANDERPAAQPAATLRSLP